MQPIKQIHDQILVLPERNIDTDQIIPARFLTTTARQGLGRHAFADWRFQADGRERPRHPFQQGGRILVAGDNFGCGSSREHAPWALLDFGFKAVISSRIADIFKANALKNGLVAIEVDEMSHRLLLGATGQALTIDLASQQLRLGDRLIDFALDPFSRLCLMQGQDQLGFILGQGDAIAAFEAGRPA
ncbi:3-isopropylmalate dehydratase small subunit [Gallaecimonas sp. GXIMD4217]|uniref:3-isopropylmalate dehydratase small subunit n=1 Tax=Gallaecimonas sp. GXIMD4217 TaxID=3131927 RepID=UPI00311ACC04